MKDKVIITLTSFKPVVYVSDSFKQKVRFLCDKVPDKEWSGLLIYDYTGSIREKNLRFELKDIFLMDIGSGGYTSYEMDEDVVQYLMEHNNPHYGHIHSHNKMKAFFSATDIDEIADNAFAYNVYLSVVTNNDLSFVGKITSNSTKSTFDFKDIDEVPLSLSLNNNIITIRDCDFEYESSSIDVDENFKKRFEIIDNKRSKLPNPYYNNTHNINLFDTEHNKQPFRNYIDIPQVDTLDKEDELKYNEGDEMWFFTDDYGYELLSSVVLGFIVTEDSSFVTALLSLNDESIISNIKNYKSGIERFKSIFSIDLLADYQINNEEALIAYLFDSFKVNLNAAENIVLSHIQEKELHLKLETINSNIKKYVYGRFEKK